MVSELLAEQTASWCGSTSTTPTRATSSCSPTSSACTPSSVEDALDPHQRDKYVHYERHVFLVCHAIELDVERAELRTIELNVFIGDTWLVTVHRRRTPT